MNVVTALNAVMRDVQAVGKLDRNDQQRFMFRGIDAVINAVGPALRDHGVLFVPYASELTSEQYETKNKTVMRNVSVKIEWRIYGPEGDHIEACTYGEAADAGDKAITKAHSVAYRTAMLQALCIPTDEPDPDASSHERSEPARSTHRPDPPAQSPRALAWARVWGAAGRESGKDGDELREWIVQHMRARELDGAKTVDLERFADLLEAGQSEVAPF